VHLDLSYLGSHLGLEWLVDRFGAGRLLFGTGAPVRDPADAVTRLLWSELPDADVAAIGAGNLSRLIGGDLC
jgi:predicted TIM-barrel fold metal-dependent hydrolase